MSAILTWTTLRFPREVTSTQGLAALFALNGLSTPRRRHDLIVLQVSGSVDGIVHQVGMASGYAEAVTHQLQTAIPGLSVVDANASPVVAINRAWQAWHSTPRRPLNTRNPEIIASGILAALASVRKDEALYLQWLLGPVRRPLAVGSKMHGDVAGSGLGRLALAPILPPGDLDADGRTALRNKQSLPGWRACLRVGVHAQGVARQRQLLGRLAAAVRVSQGAGVQLGFQGCRPAYFQTTRLPWRWPVAINVAELLGLTGWPMGELTHLPLARVTSRALPPNRSVPSRGRILGEATYPGQERPLALSSRDALQHLHVIGPTGVGKSTLLLNLIVQSVAAGDSCVVIEPKGDLIADVLARIPDERLHDVVLLDPTDPAPVGLNPLAQRGVPAELVVDQVLAVFKGLFADSWGPRTQDILTAGLLTLVSQRGLSLVALPLLFTDASFRHRLVHRLTDRLALEPFWAWYEALSAAEQAAVLAPLMNKLRVFLLRPRLRRVIGQAEPKFDLREVFTKRRVLLVNLAKGQLGPEAAGLLGSLVVSQLWQTALGRATVSPERRPPVFVFIDEFQDYLHLPTDLAEVLAQARGMGVGLALAHQHLGQVSNPGVKAAVLANARSRVVFQTNIEDAAVLTKTDARLSPQDVAGLPAYEAYMSLVAHGEVTPFASARTMPPPPAVRDADEARRRSRSQWGVPVAEIDAALEALVKHETGRYGKADDQGSAARLGVRRRSSRPHGNEEGER